MSLVEFPERAVALSPTYLGTVDYWAMLSAYGRVVIDDTARFDKRLKSTHRCVIADVNGPLQLTVPIEKPVSMTAAHWNDIRLSSHGQWWHQHRVALESAYGGTPFFEYYADRFAPFCSASTLEAYPTLTSLTRAMDGVIAEIIGIEGCLDYASETPVEPGATDFRGRLLPELTPVEYYQVRSLTQGFLPHMSIVDLIFNMGPETPLILKKMIISISHKLTTHYF